VSRLRYLLTLLAQNRRKIKISRFDVCAFKSASLDYKKITLDFKRILYSSVKLIIFHNLRLRWWKIIFNTAQPCSNRERDYPRSIDEKLLGGVFIIASMQKYDAFLTVMVSLFSVEISTRISPWKGSVRCELWCRPVLLILFSPL
jgi:hypothetical protein